MHEFVGGGEFYSFAKTPLKAAQAPLAAARASHGVLRTTAEVLRVVWSFDGDSGGMLDGRRGSAWVSMVVGADLVMGWECLEERGVRRMGEKFVRNGFVWTTVQWWYTSNVYCTGREIRVEACTSGSEDINSVTGWIGTLTVC